MGCLVPFSRRANGRIVQYTHDDTGPGTKPKPSERPLVMASELDGEGGGLGERETRSTFAGESCETDRLGTGGPGPRIRQETCLGKFGKGDRVIAEGYAVKPAWSGSGPEPPSPIGWTGAPSGTTASGLRLRGNRRMGWRKPRKLQDGLGQVSFVHSEVRPALSRRPESREAGHQGPCL